MSAAVVCLTLLVCAILTWSGVATMVGALYEVPRSAPSGSRVGAAVTTVLTAISLVIYLIINKGKQMEL